MARDWPFQDPPNTAVFVSERITTEREWVYYVTHDAEDGAWQFHPHSGPTPMEEVKVVGLGRVLEIEPRVAELADLPLGWHAWRESHEADWQRAPMDA